MTDWARLNKRSAYHCPSSNPDVAECGQSLHAAGFVTTEESLMRMVDAGYAKTCEDCCRLVGPFANGPDDPEPAGYHYAYDAFGGCMPAADEREPEDMGSEG